MGNGYPHSTIAQILEDIISQINFNGSSHSNIADILLSILNRTPYDEEPRSVLAELFLKLKAKIEGEPFDPYDKETHSVIADILISILNETEYTDVPQSRIAELLLELKEELEAYTEITVSGSIVSFTTNVLKPLVKLEANVVAMQDLHGQEYPYPAGGGANKWGSLKMAQDFEEKVNSYTLDTTNKTFTYGRSVQESGSWVRPLFSGFKANTQYTVIWTCQLTAEGQNNSLRIAYTDNTSENITVSSTTKTTIVVVSNASKTIDNIYMTYGTTTITKVYYEESGVLEGVKTASDFVPYSNICPITGWSGANVTRTGKNLFGNKPFSNWVSVGSYKALKNILPNNQSMIMSFSDNDNTVDVSGIYFGFLSSSWTGTSGTAPKLSDYRWVISNGVIGANKTNTSVSGGNLLNSVFIHPNTEEAYNKLFARYYVQIELGSTATTYEPYNGNTYTISFGDTYYGGELDVTNGVLRVTHGYVDLSTLIFYYQTQNCFYATRNDAKGGGTIISSAYRYTGISIGSTRPDLSISLATYYGSHSISIKDTRYDNTSIADFRASLNGVQAVYELETPFTIQLSPQQIEQLEENNIWADTGDVEVTYLYKGTPET